MGHTLAVLWSFKGKGEISNDYYEVPAGSIKWKKTRVKKYAILWKKGKKKESHTCISLLCQREKTGWI